MKANTVYKYTRIFNQNFQFYYVYLVMTDLHVGGYATVK